MKAENYKDEGYKLMGDAFEVYNEQDHGLAEEIYQESLWIPDQFRSQRHFGMEAVNSLRTDSHEGRLATMSAD